MCFGGLVTTTAAVKLGHGAVLHGCITHVGEYMAMCHCNVAFLVANQLYQTC
jgi:hypothetical protein